MNLIAPIIDRNLIGIGVYTPAEAGRLLALNPARITRWLRGDQADGRQHQPLWTPQIELGGEGIFLGFRDLQEVRVAAAFIARGLSPQKVRQAIVLARELVADTRPLSTARFRSHGRSIVLQVAEEEGQTSLIDLFQKQYAFQSVIETSLTYLEYDGMGIPSRWWPLGPNRAVVVDPKRSFGQPIEAETGVPSALLAAAVETEGSASGAARAWGVPLRAVNRAVRFERDMATRNAA